MGAYQRRRHLETLCSDIFEHLDEVAEHPMEETNGL